MGIQFQMLGEIDFVDKISISDLNIGQKGIVSRL